MTELALGTATRNLAGMLTENSFEIFDHPTDGSACMRVTGVDGMQTAPDPADRQRWISKDEVLDVIQIGKPLFTYSEMQEKGFFLDDAP